MSRTLAHGLCVAAAVTLLGAGGARARDLPRGAAAPRLTGCETFGPGFRKIEGSDTCVRLSGSVEMDAVIRSGGSASGGPGGGGNKR